ncbi:diaminopropionate ammonia-lyase [Chelativorans intermedius]|uniref:Diaminopropionate ammonia-lyase n=1 Tax=Chelativorans intermedius TaxID=515947 RepID=A0ABV6DD21_9HYPH|nr:diaminopropionate ammonia-lyase [Chelativorans intermedius]MCT9000560.1 diaminopropionate ammonia-lyase [Chelativorans intermedius]
MKIVENRAAAKGAALSPHEAETVGLRAPEIVAPFIAACPKHAATPLVPLPGLAASLEVAGIDLKDEGQRLGLKSFKALGGAYAVARLVHEHVEARLGRKVAPSELRDEAVRPIAGELTVCCATDGNHGRSVAAGARLFGCRCVIFLHEGVSKGREQAIAGFGAEIRRTDGNYDASVAEATEVAEREGWTTVSDFSWPGYERIPGLVMQGYTVMLAEIAEQMQAPYTHIFVQGGVGGLAAAVAGYFHDWLGKDRPKLVVVEPDRAACLQASAEQGERLEIAAGDSTVMAMLECYEPSLIAWQILEKSADAYIDIPDGAAVDMMRRLARPAGGDPALEIGESGVAGLAGLAMAAAQPELRARLGLDGGSRILVIGTEGATDPVLYRQLVGDETVADEA